MTQTPTLNDVFTNWISDGIFKYLNALDVPWKDKANSEQLNIIYHGSRSGRKPIGSLIDYMLSNDTLTEANKTSIATAIYTVYAESWKHLWSTLNYEYNPIENYSMTETETIKDIHIGTISHDGSEIAVTSNNVVTTTQDTGQLYGFNSNDPVNADKQLGDDTTDASGNTNTTTKNTDTENRNMNTDRTLKRSGNIGVTTSQQMIESERQLWLWNYFEKVFEDIDKILVIKIY